MALNGSTTNQALLDAQLELWQSTFGYIKSMALKSAVDLGIADAINHHGGGATLPQIVSRVTLHSSKIPNLHRLMRALVAAGVFTVQHSQSPAGSGGEPMYMLTPVSRLLVGSQPQSLAPLTSLLVHPTLVTTFFGLGKWFQRELPDPCLFKQAHGQTLWEQADRDAAFDALVNDAMVSDSSFIMDIVIEEHADAFRGISSLVDVGGGLGAAAQAISNAFPDVKCSVFDLDHVVAKAPSDTKVRYVVGDMFESVPPANAMFFKWVLHDWDDEECVVILKNCRKAIPSREEGGKVVIIDMVVGVGPSDHRHKEIQALFDVYMMIVNGKERDEQEWKKIFFRAGFSDYKITPVLGVRSIIEVYP